MLTGRESLIRLVGKRRRFLPSRQALLSTPLQTSLTQCKDENGGIASTRGAEGSASEQGSDVADVSGNLGNKECAVGVSTSDWVTCPVCGNAVRGEECTINSHLDACLTRGTKRKMTQLTLLQLNFCSRSKDALQCCESNNSVTNEAWRETESSVAPNTVSMLSNINDAEENYDYGHSLCSNLETSRHTHDDSSTRDSSSDCNNYKLDTPLLQSENGKPIFDTAVTMGNISRAVLHTFIVGRRFSEEGEVNLGASVSLLRDPNNVKDSNAIKVLSINSGCCKMLGFLPRELAQYLSPLIHEYGLSFEGCITSVPEDSLDVVPIQLVCQKSLSSEKNEYDNVQVFESLWKNLLRVVESAKTYPSNMAKYQKNFFLLVQEVLASNSHILTDDEKIFLESFTTLSDDSQRLFVRLYMRKGPWFRISNISYQEILDSQKAIKELLAAGYISSFESTNELHYDDINEVLNVLTVSELQEITYTLKKKCTRGTRKRDFIASLLSLYQDGLCSHLPSVVLEKTGACIRISTTAESLIWRAQRLFFLNGEQDLSAFLLVDLGIIKYPNYNCIITKQIFCARSDLLAYEEAIEVAQIMDQSLDEDNFELVLRCTEISDSCIFSSSANATQSSTSKSCTTFFLCFSASWVYSKVVSLGISFLEHEHRRGYWTLRLSIDLEHVGYLNESLSVAEDGLLDPWVRAGSKIALQRRVLRLGKPPRRWKIPSFSESVKRKITEVHIQGRPLNCKTGTKSRFYGEDGEQCGVEQLALQYYASEGGGWHGVHTESGIWLTIFALLLWDIIFADVPDVFRNKFQTAPLDLETDCFYVVRKDIIELQLQKIRNGMAEEILIISWESHVGTTCRGVNWDRHSLSELRAAVTCIGGPCLSSICRLLAQDYRSWSSGMPDLLLWRFHGDYRGEAKLVEVKGPRDRLSEQQQAWLLLLMDSGFSTEVCKVSPLEC
ncbi:fanconi-associated nuclease 1 homolog isoform X2 [Malania oleifera]|uniref:fanconi-associated nuclease 1 homolog isoform X2 n=1 Tax=Malania oleifera TaxID=397392 RepID=UPI0025AE353D|nr:fanconi-associated nuclease 1 homolog isoform X2 [Malania oleifera]